MSALAVRPAQREDADALFSAWLALRTYYASVDRRIIPAPVSRDEFLAAYAELLARPTSASFVAVEGKQLVGFISGGIEPNQPDRLPDQHVGIGQFYVAESHRRHGLGTSLFRALASWAESQDGVSHFEMPVLALDREAGAFWRSLGFTPFIERLWGPLGGTEDGP